MNKQVMYQLAFDFYDCNNDEKISEIDIYKIFQFFGDQRYTPNSLIADDDIFINVIGKDVTVLTRIVKWLNT